MRNAPVCKTEAPPTDCRINKPFICNPPSPSTEIAPWGPWSPVIDAGERRCQLHCPRWVARRFVRHDCRYWSIIGQRIRVMESTA